MDVIPEQFEVGTELHTFYGGHIDKPMCGKIMSVRECGYDTIYGVLWSYPTNCEKKTHTATNTHEYLVEMIDACLNTDLGWTIIPPIRVELDEDLFMI